MGRLTPTSESPSCHDITGNSDSCSDSPLCPCRSIVAANNTAVHPSNEATALTTVAASGCGATKASDDEIIDEAVLKIVAVDVTKGAFFNILSDKSPVLGTLLTGEKSTELDILLIENKLPVDDTLCMGILFLYLTVKFIGILWKTRQAHGFTLFIETIVVHICHTHTQLVSSMISSIAEHS